MNNRRTGKIARLPKALRDVVCLMLRDGATYKQIVEVLEEHRNDWPREITEIDENNIGRWKDGGYCDWLKEQERLEDMKAKREFAMQIVRENEGSRLHEATLHLAASQLYETLTDFDLTALKELLAAKPENYAHIVNSLAKLSKGALELEKFKDRVRERDERIQAELNRAKSSGGLTPETIERIERELKLL